MYRRFLLPLLAAAALADGTLTAPSPYLGDVHLFSLPELRSRQLTASGGRFYRALAASPSGAYPEVHDSHAFEGFTASGLYVNFSSASIAAASTILTEHYGALLDLAESSCESGDGGTLHLRLSFPAPLSGEDEGALAHLLARAALPGAHLVLGAATLLRHGGAFAGGGGCAPPTAAAGAPAPPVFSLRVERAAPPHRVALALTPAPLAAAFPYLSFSLAVGGGGGGGGGGGSLRRRRGAALSLDSPRVDFGVNYDAASGGALSPKLQFFPATPDALFCDGCFFALRGAALHATLQVCSVVRRDGLVYYYDAGRVGYYGGVGGTCVQGSGAGCRSGAAGGDAAARAATDCAAPPGGLGTGQGAGALPPALDLGVRATAAVEGAAALRIALRSLRGFAAAAAFPSNCAGDVAACTRAPLPELPLPTAGTSFSLAAGGVPILVAPSLALEGAAVADGAAPALGLALGFEGSAPAVRFGAAVAFASAAAAPASSSGEAAFAPTLCAAAYALSGLPSGGAGALTAVGATLAPRLRVAVGGLLAFSAVPAFSLRQGVGRGSSISSSSGGSLACGVGAGATPVAAGASGSLSLAMEAAFLLPLSAALTGVAGVPGAVDALVVPAALLVDPAVTPLSLAGAVAPGPLGACVAAGESLVASALCAPPPVARTWSQYIADNRAVVAGSAVGAVAAACALLAAVAHLRGRAARARSALQQSQSLQQQQQSQQPIFSSTKPPSLRSRAGSVASVDSRGGGGDSESTRGGSESTRGGSGGGVSGGGGKQRRSSRRGSSRSSGAGSSAVVPPLPGEWTAQQPAVENPLAGAFASSGGASSRTPR